MSKKYYVTNKELLVEIKTYLEEDVITERLGKMILQIANGVASKPNFSGYTWREDMVSEGVLTVLKYMKNFDPEKSSNPFSYFTMIIYNAFIQYLNQQKKHSKIKNRLFDSQNNINENNEEYLSKAINYQLLMDSEK